MNTSNIIYYMGASFLSTIKSKRKNNFSLLRITLPVFFFTSVTWSRKSGEFTLPAALYTWRQYAPLDYKFTTAVTSSGSNAFVVDLSDCKTSWALALKWNMAYTCGCTELNIFSQIAFDHHKASIADPTIQSICGSER